MNRTIMMGTFDAERFWRSQNYTKLPGVTAKDALPIVSSMDELLFPLCGPGDTLITRFKMEPSFVNYLQGIGFPFQTQYLQTMVPLKEEIGECCVFKLLAEQRDNPCFKELFQGEYNLSPYAVLPETRRLCKFLLSQSSVPQVEDVIRINSKVYSHCLHDILGLKKFGAIVYQGEELQRYASEVSNDKALLIKDPYGVSGKGNLLITSQGLLNRIIQHIVAQESKGFSTCLLVEPLLDKVHDFSCQLYIHSSGAVEFSSTQMILNQGFSYLGSLTADEEFINQLESKGYFDVITRAAHELYRDGYFGDVCIDSMMLRDGEIVPIVEINARKSMGLINYYIDKYLTGYSRRGYFNFFSVGLKGDSRPDDLLTCLDEAGILFNTDEGLGILPLSSNTLFINQNIEQLRADPGKVYKGRFYFSAVEADFDKKCDLMMKTRDVLKRLGFTIYN